MSKRIKCRLTFTEELLGTWPSDENIAENYIAANAPDMKTFNDEMDAIDGVDENKRKTIFPRGENGNPVLYDYQIKGFFKDSCSALARIKASESSKLKAYKKVIDGNVFVYPRKIKLGSATAIGSCQRPLRASTPQGERVALANSETLPAGTACEFTVVLLENSHYGLFREWMDYGQAKGIGQWRNSGKGRFKYEILSEEDIPLMDALKF